MSGIGITREQIAEALWLHDVGNRSRGGIIEFRDAHPYTQGVFLERAAAAIAVPQSFPETERVAEVLAAAIDGMTSEQWRNASMDYRAEIFDGAEAVLALMGKR